MWRRGLLRRDVELSTIPSQHQSEDRLINSPSEESHSFRKDAPVQQHQQSLDGERFQGWRFTVFLAFIASLVVLLLNLGFLLYTVAHHRLKDQKGVLYQGDCVKVQHMSTGFHLLVNVLSTALLAASNFGMQCLCAPTRQNIDRAHQQGKWLDIGVPSIRNLFRVSPWRSFLWLCLASSSLPFHLVYNSTIFSTTSAMEYNIFLGKGSLGQKPLSNLHLIAPGSEFRASFEGLHASAQNGTLQRLDNSQCVDAFAQTFQTTYSNLLLVTDDVKENDTYLYFTTQEVFNPWQYLVLPQPEADPYRWLCPGDLFDDCSTYLPTVRSQIAHNNWTVTERPDRAISWKVNYCLAEKGRQLCKLQYSFPLIMLIIGFNLVKTCILCYMWLGIRDAPLLTIGDAIASFLHRSDPTTQGACLLTRRRAPALLRKRSLHQPEKYTGKRRRWDAAASARRWMFSIILWLIAITGCIILLVYGIHNVQSGTSAWKLSLGAINATTLIKGDNWPGSLIPIVIIANMPQLIFSFLYFASNALLTAMNVAAEWSGFAVQRKGLRVSGNRVLAQRRYYFLSLPYRYAVPLLAASAVLHWLISQSLFMVEVEAYDYNMLRLAKRDVVTCGYSPVAIVCAIAVGGSMFLCTLGLGFRRLDSAMPVAGSCSLAIAAACHPAFDPNGSGGGDGDAESEYGDEDMGLLPVKWGAVPVDGGIGHCSFTAGEVETPVAGQLYQ